ncbi:MAG: 2-oxoglutarate dehydrogenase complex dihydrolipoyllysine-residue succinyltransferase [Gammaproteobacteria bacterium]|nr:2-oxoglutarate dehydrogenase complex dihydrolipoyllysine-residue succinyltransferase [Gammaproteobacteria bacterium]
MAIEIKVPGFPESVSDGTIGVWHKKPGDAVKRDDVLVEIETDKVVFEVPAPNDGVLSDIIEDEGATVLAQQVIAHMEAGAVAANENVKEAVTENVSETANEEGIVSPAARRMLAEHKLSADQITGTGKDGRILKEDIQAFLAKGKSQSTPAPVKEQISFAAAPATPAPIQEMDGDRPQKRVPMTRLRKRIAERLVESQQTAAILTTFNEVNMQPVMDMRTKYQKRFVEQYGVKLGFMSFFVKAAVEALKQFPEVNASIEGDDIVYHGFYDIGIAVGSPRGLVVPILRDADQLSMAQVESLIKDYGQKAQDGSLSIEDITGGTFTITNGGVFGSMLSTPIINPPQSGILGMHAINKKPVVVDDEIVIRPMMYLALSYDHRIIDGRGAVQFLVTIKELLEDPARILLEV